MAYNQPPAHHGAWTHDIHCERRSGLKCEQLTTEVLNPGRLLYVFRPNCVHHLQRPGPLIINGVGKEEDAVLEGFFT